jgi:hypothetical protein
MKRYAFLLLGMSLVFALAVTAGAAQKAQPRIQLTSSSYNPKVSGKVADLKGRTIILWAFNNNAKDTRRYEYYNSAQDITYETPEELLPDYLWYGMRKYLWAAGMKVFQAPSPAGTWSATIPSQIPPDAPTFGINFTSWTDMGFVCEATITKPGRPPVQKAFIIAFDAPSLTDPKSLETRAYESLDKIIETIFADPVIKDVLTK